MNAGDMNNLDGVSILVAEDEDGSFRTIERILNGAGAVSMRAINGLQAVEIALERNDIALILMDIKMPLMNGIEATRRIKEIKPDIKVIATSAFAMPGDRKIYLDSGCDDFIQKPLSADKLIGIIVKHLNSAIN